MSVFLRNSGDEVSKLDFGVFIDYLNQGNLTKAKSLVTKTNVKNRDEGVYGVLFYLCFYGPSDDHDMLYHFVELGATLELDSAGKRPSPLHKAAYKGKPRLLRALLDLGTPVDILDGLGYTPLYASMVWNKVNCVGLLLDAGAQPNLSRGNIKLPVWASDFVLKREKARKSSISILGLLLCKSKVTGKNGKDVLRMVARCTWSLRGL